MKNVVILIIFTTCITSLKSQMYSEPKKAKAQIEQPKKTIRIKDSIKTRQIPGFILNVTAGINRGVSSGNYRIYYPYRENYGPYFKNYSSVNNDYKIKNSFGYRFGIGIGLQWKKLTIEIPITYSVDRFQVPEISSSDYLKIGSIEFGLNQYFKIFKGKHNIILGEYLALDDQDGYIHSVGLNLGYGYNILKRLNISLRYKFNLNSLDRSRTVNNTIIQFNKGSDYDHPDLIESNYNSLQLVVRYDLIHKLNKVKYKKRKKKQPKVKKPKDDYEYLNQQNTYTPPPTKVAVDYSGYSNSDLNLALKEANTKSDLDAMLGIQKELDKRKQADEFSKYSYVQLEQEMNKAIDKEDYKRADMIKKEMAKRDTKKGMPSDNKPANDLESKSIEELNKLKDEAIQKEDYDKAKQIQDIINKKKP